MKTIAILVLLSATCSAGDLYRKVYFSDCMSSRVFFVKVDPEAESGWVKVHRTHANASWVYVKRSDLMRALRRAFGREVRKKIIE